MELGMPTLIENKNLSESASLCMDLGLDFIELNMNLPMYQVEGLDKIQNLKDIADKYRIGYTIHLDENLDVCNFNSSVAGAWLDTVDSTIQAAKNLDVPVINMHMTNGVYFTLPQERVYLFDKYRDTYMCRLKKFRELCEDVINGDDILITIENTDGFLPFQIEGIEMLLESKVFALTWDIGHSHSAGRIDEKFILGHKEYLKHMHIHDAIGSKNHLELGTGEINLQEKLEVAKECRCRCVIETKTVDALRQSVKWLQSLKKILL